MLLWEIPLFSSSEADELLEAIKEMEQGHENIMLMLGKLMATAEANLEQAKKTNGRVNVLEDKVDDLESIRDKGIGGWKVVVGLGGGLLGVIGLFISIFK